MLLVVQTCAAIAQGPGMERRDHCRCSAPELLAYVSAEIVDKSWRSQLLASYYLLLLLSTSLLLMFYSHTTSPSACSPAILQPFAVSLS